MIEFEHVGKRYGELTAVDDLSFTVAEGKVTVLIGPSGCGKTTSLRMVNRMIEPTDGYIRVQGKPVKSFPPEELRRGIGYVIQSVGLFPHMTVENNIGIVPKLLKWDKARRRRRAIELLELIGLDPETYIAKYPDELSGGEAQRIGVARALASDPPILLMDEPFGAVDPLNREVLQNEFLALQRKLRKTVIFVTHDLDEAIRLADTIVLMKDGKLVQEDSPERILAAPRNQFVRDFVGTDRALKRLACFNAADYMKRAETVAADKLGAPAAPPAYVDVSGIVWVLDGAERLVGMIQRETPEGSESAVQAATVENRVGEEHKESYIPLRAKEIGISRLASLREALSRILGQGVKAVPVLDDAERIIGEVRLPDIEELNQASGVYR